MNNVLWRSYIVTIEECQCHHRKVAFLLAVYENNMYKRFAELEKETMNNTAWMHSADSLSLMLIFQGYKRAAGAMAAKY